MEVTSTAMPETIDTPCGADFFLGVEAQWELARPMERVFQSEVAVEGGPTRPY
jgi:hypothetical protein